jgi:hypothetical protein
MHAVIIMGAVVVAVLVLIELFGLVMLWKALTLIPRDNNAGENEVAEK